MKKSASESASLHSGILSADWRRVKPEAACGGMELFAIQASPHYP